MSTFVEEKRPLLGNNSQLEECIAMTAVTTSSSLAPNTSSNVPAASRERLNSLDQFRGFVILCSLIVPLLGRLDASPDVFKHKSNFFSLAGSYMGKITQNETYPSLISF
jgi:hypothetical protein